MGEVRQVVSPPFPFTFPSPPLSIPLSFQTNQWEGRSDPVRGEFPGFPPYNYHPVYILRPSGLDRQNFATDRAFTRLKLDVVWLKWTCCTSHVRAHSKVTHCTAAYVF